jgi:hypothetical protein
MIKVNKEINLEQLDAEFNGLGLIATLDENLIIVEVGLADQNTGTEKQLEAIIDKHVAQPKPEPTVDQKLSSVGLNLEDLKTALGL